MFIQLIVINAGLGQNKQFLAKLIESVR